MDGEISNSKPLKTRKNKKEYMLVSSFMGVH